MGKKFFQSLFVLGVVLCTIGALLYFRKKESAPPINNFPSSGLIAQNNYMGPIQPIPGHPYLVRVEVLVRDSAVLGGVQIQSVEFNGQSIPLKPRDIFGKRAQASFQVPPGKYSLKWVVQRDKINWPRTMDYEEEVAIDPRDLWVQISIQGEEVSIR